MMIKWFIHSWLCWEGHGLVQRIIIKPQKWVITYPWSLQPLSQMKEKGINIHKWKTNNKRIRLRADQILFYHVQCKAAFVLPIQRRPFICCMLNCPPVSLKAYTQNLISAKQIPFQHRKTTTWTSAFQEWIVWIVPVCERPTNLLKRSRGACSQHLSPWQEFHSS